MILGNYCLSIRILEGLLHIVKLAKNELELAKININTGWKKSLG